eukprot:3431130-Rhodomonas_salina.2
MVVTEERERAVVGSEEAWFSAPRGGGWRSVDVLSAQFMIPTRSLMRSEGPPSCVRCSNGYSSIRKALRSSRAAWPAGGRQCRARQTKEA